MGFIKDTEHFCEREAKVTEELLFGFEHVQPSHMAPVETEAQNAGLL